ncbi:hypothetical protein T492DRAFT_933597 [Pavlovales sp. CCMP2436]|nr:hypothetical protein T492DRAFT_933597 [Pavlovales sp. CCMP2436]|mmetsp:Transcript_44694/g.110827  ORF Transcript_44694/g.110827 Transcript_44694/m.110827 type:complete len:98 (+) Transcript_44694:61-354(+)
MEGGPGKAKSPIYFWDEGRRFLDVWAMDGKPFWETRTLHRVNGIKWLSCYVSAVYLVFGADWGDQDNFFSEPQRWARGRYDRFWALPEAAEEGAAVR